RRRATGLRRADRHARRAASGLTIGSKLVAFAFLGELVTGGWEVMPFTFKLSKRLALSKAVRAPAARALCALRQASTHPPLADPASSTSTPLQSAPRVSWGSLSSHRPEC